MSAIYEKHPSPSAFSRLHLHLGLILWVVVIAPASGAHGSLVTTPFGNS
jgi:hypothetical protein